MEGPLGSAIIYSFALSRNHFFARRFLVIALALHIAQVTYPAFGQTRPANDNFADAIQVTGTNFTVHGSNVNATREPGEPNHAHQPGGKSVWWTWQAPQTGYATLSTLGSVSSVSGELDTLLGVYRGSVVSNLTEVAYNDDGPIDLTSQVTFHAIAGTTYQIAVDGYSFDPPADADSGSIVLSLTFSDSLPTAPAWGPLPSIYGTMIGSTNFAGKVVLLNFWATWCGPCMAEVPDLISLQQKYTSDGFTVVGISVDDSADGVNPPTSLVSSVVASHGIDYPIVMSRPRGTAVETAYGGIAYIPSTFIIDRQNHIVQTFVGTQTYATYEQAILPLLYADLKLNVTSTNGMLHLSWPATQARFGVETTSDVSTGSWSPLGLPVQSDGAKQWIDFAPGTGNQFFRLRGQ
jgi:thiol-disulfide isomerase/thioredoxin